MNRLIVTGLALGLLVAASPVGAQTGAFSDGVIRIGVLNDRAGPYSDATGEGSVVAVRLAAEDFGNAIAGVPIEIVVGDHQGKPDVGVVAARRWFDTEKVDAISDIASSGVGFAVNELAAERGRVLLNNSASSDFTGKACKPLSVQWNYNSYANTNAVVSAVMGEGGRDTWFIIAPDYAYGQAQAADVRRFVEGKGGKVVGSVAHPVGGADFSSYLLQAQSSGAKVIALANSANDLVNTVKQAREFGVGQDGKQALVVVSAVNLTEIDALGLEPVQGLLFLSTFEWNRTPESRAWTERFVKKMGRLPSQNQAAAYSGAHHYLAAIKAAGTDEPRKVMEQMRAMPVRDAYAENGQVREDGQMVHDLYLVRAKKPSESKEKGDYFTLVKTFAGADSFQPLSASACPAVKK